MKRQRFKNLIVILLTAFPLCTSATISIEQADTIVYETMAVPLLEKVEIYRSMQEYEFAEEILIFDNTSIYCPYIRALVYFIDDKPLSGWAHHCHYILVDKETGEYTKYQQRFFPVNWHKEYELMHTPFTNEESTRDISMISPNPSIIPIEIDTDPHLYAVLLADGYSGEIHFWKDICMVYNMLLKKGYAKENIFLHYGNGEVPYDPRYPDMTADFDKINGADDIDYLTYPTVEPIAKTFRELAGELHVNETDDPNIPVLTPKDNLFVFVASHGEYEISTAYSYSLFTGYGNRSYKLYDHELRDFLQHINCGQLLIVTEACEAGGFVDQLTDIANHDFACKNRLVISGSDIAHTTNTEAHLSSRTMTEFTFYWTAAASGKYPRVTSPWEFPYVTGEFDFNYGYTWICTDGNIITHPPDHDPDLDNNGFVSMHEVYDYTRDLNSWDKDEFFCQPRYYTYVDVPKIDYTSNFMYKMMTITGIQGEVKENMNIEGSFYVSGDVTIKSGNTLTVSKDATLNFKDGTTFTVEDGATLYLQYSDNLYINGNVNFIIEEGAIVNISNYAILIVDENATLNYMGGTISLNGSSARLFSKGELNIAENKTFTFNGSGYVRLEGTVTAGNNTKIIIDGTGKTDKVLEINNKSISLPTSLSQFKVTDGLIYMIGSSAQIKTNSSQTAVYLSNTMVRSNGNRDHKGIYLKASSNVSVENCSFENGYYGLYASMYSNSSILNVNNSTFNNCRYGIVQYRSGIDLTGCDFTDCYYGLYSRYMNKPSTFDDCNFNSNDYRGIYYQGYSSSSLFVNETNINGNYRGIHADGPFNLRIKCSEIKNNTYAGIYLSGETTIYLNDPGQSNISNNKYGIQADVGYVFYLNSGLNDLHPLSISGSYAMLGRYMGYNGSVNAYNNKWNTLNKKPIYGSDYLLYGGLTDPRGNLEPLTVIDNYPITSFQYCFTDVILPFGSISIDNDEFIPVNENYEVRTIYTEHFNSVKLNKAIFSIKELIERKEENIQVEEMLYEILNYNFEDLNEKEAWYLELALYYYKNIIGSYDFENTDFNQKVDKLINKLISNFEKGNLKNKLSKEVYFNIHKSHLYFLGGRQEKALKLLYKLYEKIEDEFLKEIIRKEICQIEMDVSLQDENLTPDEIEHLIVDCSRDSKMLKSGDLENSKDENFILNDSYSNILEIIPNPVVEQSIIRINANEETELIICIYDFTGRLIAKEKLSNKEKTIFINNNDYQEGLYQVVLYKNNIPLDSKKIILIK